ncbi:GLC3, partial [Symbiodinium sp. KB8]
VTTDLPPGATLWLCGGCPALGGWDPARGLQLEGPPPTAGHITVFEATLHGKGEARERTQRGLRPGNAAPQLPESFECKLVWKSDSAGLVWEDRPNRVVRLVDLPVPEDAPLLVASWRPYALSADFAATQPATSDGDGATGQGSPAPPKAPWMGVIDSSTHGDPWLEAHRPALAARAARATAQLCRLDEESAAIGRAPLGLDGVSSVYDSFGLVRQRRLAQAGWLFREWAPAALAASLVGDFNGWDTHAHRCAREEGGTWSIFLPDAEDGTPVIGHEARYKLCLVIPGSAPAADGEALSADECSRLGLAVSSPPPRRVWRLPAWARCCRPAGSDGTLEAVAWNPPPDRRHRWRHGRVRWHEAVVWAHEASAPGLSTIATAPDSSPQAAAGSAAAAATAATAATTATSAAVPSDPSTGSAKAAVAGSATPTPRPAQGHAAGGLRIYECHAGLAGDEPRVHSYAELADRVLPRVAALGYNAVQLMGAVEHAYYASFGYLINGFFAPAGRSGDPEAFKAMVDVAHGLGLAVVIDLVHAHASSNVADGLNGYDGSDSCFFHEGGKGRHSAWGSRLFAYGRPPVTAFLLANLRFWVEEYRVDGFRFDGVTSMLYHHHGIGHAFTGSYDEYFGADVDEEAVSYLTLANLLCHCLDPPALTVAEDVSGMATLCRPVREGGVGFDFRLAMGVPDEWIRLVKDVSDEDWDVGHIAHVLTDRRWQEKCVAYAESHDQVRAAVPAAAAPARAACAGPGPRAGPGAAAAAGGFESGR